MREHALASRDLNVQLEDVVGEFERVAVGLTRELRSVYDLHTQPVVDDIAAVAGDLLFK